MKRIMSGKYSEDMWKAINNAKTKSDLQDALYFVCCRLQELESKYDNEIKKIEDWIATAKNCKNFDFKLSGVKEKKK